ncbi:imidazolonepropionase [candidate division KSB1 bacterium]|nr:imidazolonepropionase [candidate division KSB1 bacterium]
MLNNQRTVVDLIIYNCGQLITMQGADRPRIGEEMNDLAVLPDGAVAAANGRIVAVGTTEEIRDQFRPVEEEINAESRLVMPGFVDPHTHLVFGGSREHEMARKAAGETYLDILKSGGGINSTVRATRKTDEEHLFQTALHRLNMVAMHGTTTIEIKSGYGLEPNAEAKLLRVINRLDQRHVLDVIPTFLGAHIVPGDWERNEYINWLIKEALPDFGELARFCDVFCELEAFTVEESVRILSAAAALGYGLKAHAGQFNALGGAGAAAQLGALSVEHLDFVDEDELDSMRENGTIAILLPGASFFTGAGEYANPATFIERGIAVALGTDFNPGSCPCFSMQMIIALACIEMKMTATQAIIASTLNAAFATKTAADRGSLEPGKKADLILLNIETPEQLPYYFGVNLVEKVIKNGRIIYE